MGKYMRKPKITCDVAVTEPKPLGVRTRSKTLSLQNPLSTTDTSSSCFLRNRRPLKLNPNPIISPVSMPESQNDSFGDNCFFCSDGIYCRSDRESTPCSYGRELVTAETPDSTNKRIVSTVTDLRTNVSNSITQEIEEFFASAEKQQQRLFAERFNFDVVNDMPLPGRYEWVRVGN